MNYLIELGYVGMFLSAFLAGSIVPANSELVLSGLLALGLDKWLLLLWATIGNILGGLTCYYIGYLGNRDKILKLMKIKPSRLEKVEKALQGKGSWFAFFVFVPFIGDIIIVVFGLMRANLTGVTLAMSLGKFLKYFVWMWLTLGVIDLVV